MYCPYCKSEMVLGKIEAQNLLQWIPDGYGNRLVILILFHGFREC